MTDTIGILLVEDQEMVRSADNAIFAMSVLKKMAKSAESEHVRVMAAKEILTRTDAAQPDAKVVEHRHTHDVARLSDQQLAKEIRRLQRELGGFVIEGTAVNVETEERRGLPSPEAAGGGEAA